MHHTLHSFLKLNRLCYLTSLCVEDSQLEHAETEDHLFCYNKLDDRVWSLIASNSVHFRPGLDSVGLH